MDKHEATMSFSQEYNNGCKFCFLAFNLRVGTDADFQTVSLFCFPFDCIFNCFMNWQVEGFSIEFSPTHIKRGFSNLRKNNEPSNEFYYYDSVNNCRSILFLIFIRAVNPKQGY